VQKFSAYVRWAAVLSGVPYERTVPNLHFFEKADKSGHVVATTNFCEKCCLLLPYDVQKFLVS